VLVVLVLLVLPPPQLYRSSEAINTPRIRFISDLPPEPREDFTTAVLGSPMFSAAEADMMSFFWSRTLVGNPGHTTTAVHNRLG
jgi:hypothetical protein